MTDLVRYSEVKSRDRWGNIVRTIRESDRAGPVATITTLPRTYWYSVVCLDLPADEGTHCAKGLPKARRLAYTLITHAEARRP